MTHPYSVTYFSSWNYFLTEVNKQLTSQHKITFGSLDIEKQDNIKNLFKAFFSFLSKNFEVDIFYKKNSEVIGQLDPSYNSTQIVVYAGFEVSGQPHIGTYLTMKRVQSFLSTSLTNSMLIVANSALNWMDR